MIHVQARGALAAEIRIFEPIGEGLFGDGLSAKSFDDQLKGLGEVTEILVRINSPGGAVFDGLAIYNALAAHPARKTVVVEGIAASIASVIAMAGDTIRISAGAMLMVHNPWMVTGGDAEQHREAAEMLEKVGGQLVAIYAKRTGLTPTKVAALLDAETWLTGEEAIALGFADELVSDPAEKLTPAAAAALSRFRSVPREVYAMTIPTPAAADPSAILAAEQARRTDIRNLFGSFTEAHRGLLDACLDDPRCTPEAASAQLLAAVAASQVGPLAGGWIEAGRDARADFPLAAADALCIRAGLKVEKPHAGARDLQNMPLAEMAQICLRNCSARGFTRPGFGSDKARIIRAAMTTSDFPHILENVIEKSLRAGFEAEPASHTVWTKSTTVPDLKPASRAILGSAPNLDSIPEGAEYKFGALSEDKAGLQVAKYGKALRLTWEALVNDDLNSFTVIPAAMAKAARRKEADVVYTDLLLANSGSGQTMQDSVTLFHATHGNLGSAAALSVASLGAAKALLRRQTAVGGIGYLNLTPRFLLVPPEKEALAESILAQLARHSVTGSNVVEHATPQWITQLQLVVEPRLTGNPWYLIASSDQIDTCEVARLAGEDGPVVEQENAFLTDSRDYKVRHSFGARFIDWRGIVKNPGA